MKIAVISSRTAGLTDQVISESAARLAADGVALAGAVKVLENGRPGDHNCDMDLRVLPDGPEIRITQSLGEGATGCRLNPAGIAEAVAATEKNGTTGADLFFLNKFGPQESEGRGFCDAIAAALAGGIPVVVGVGACRPAFDAFVDGLAEEVPADTDAIYAWCKAAMA